MTPIDAYVDFTPVATTQLRVQDDSGSLSAIGWPVPPLGGGVDLAFARFERANLTASLDVAQRTLGYDTALAWAPTLWSTELDFGISLHMVSNSRVATLDFVAGPGLRVEILAQPWWQDYAYAGVGGHAGFVCTLGSGPVRPLLGLRASVALAPGAVAGVLDSGVQDLTWTYQAANARLGVHAGAAFR